MMAREPAQVFHIAEFLCAEMVARNWITADVAKRMSTGRGLMHDRLTLELLLSVHDDGLLMDDETCDGLGRAFGVSPTFFRNLDTIWRKWPDRRASFTPPESIFGPHAQI